MSAVNSTLLLVLLGLARAFCKVLAGGRKDLSLRDVYVHII